VPEIQNQSINQRDDLPRLLSGQSDNFLIENMVLRNIGEQIDRAMSVPEFRSDCKRLLRRYVTSCIVPRPSLDGLKLSC